MRDEEKIKAIKEVETLINNGAPIVKLDIFDKLSDFVLSESLKDLIDYTIEEYIDLLSELQTYSKDFQIKYLTLLKNTDIIDNQSIEKEDSFTAALSKDLSGEYSVDKLIEIDGGMTREEFINIHDLLIDTTDKKGLREDNLKFVGDWTKDESGNDIRRITYFPLNVTEIDEGIDKFLNYYNSNTLESDKYDLFIKPMILHALVASLQLFKDGNTRYARLIQNIDMWSILNKITNTNIPMPLLYGTRQYAAYRQEYRQRITNIAKNKENAWEEWFRFNLNRLQDAIWFNKTNIEKLSNYLESTRSRII